VVVWEVGTRAPIGYVRARGKGYERAMSGLLRPSSEPANAIPQGVKVVGARAVEGSSKAPYCSQSGFLVEVTVQCPSGVERAALAKFLAELGVDSSADGSLR
jgi:hypothetical protein